MPQSSPISIDGEDFGFFGGSGYMKGFPVLKMALEYRISQGLEPITVHATKFTNMDKNFGDRLGAFGFLVYNKLDKLDYRRVYRKIKAVIVPSVWHEPLPYVVAEALLNGRLVIASRVGGIPELIHNEKNGLLFNSGSADSLAVALKRLIDDRSLIEAFKKQIPSIKDIKADAELWIERYQKALSRQQGSYRC